MKTLFFIAVSVFFSISAMAGEGPSSSKEHPNKYCYKKMNDKLTVVHEGAALTSTVTLSDGSRVQPDGTVTRKDGTSVMLKEGECIDHEGKIMMENSKKKSSSSNNKTY